MRKFLVSFVLFLQLSVRMYANGDADSLATLLESATGNKRIDVLNRLSEVYQVQAPAKAFTFAEQALQLSSATGSDYEAGQAMALNNLGEFYLNQGSYKKSLDLFTQANDIGTRLNNQSLIGLTLSKIGVVYYFWGNNEKALQFLTQSLAIEEKAGNLSQVASILNNISYIYTREGLYIKALENHLKTLRIREKLGDQNEISKSYNSIGDFYMRQQKYEQALENYTGAYTISQKINNKKGIAISLDKVGQVYSKQGKLAEAISYHTKALQLSNDLGNRKQVATSLQNLGICYEALGNQQAALQNYLSSLALFEDLGSNFEIAGVLNAIAVIYRKQGQFKKALLHHTKAIERAKSSHSLPLLRDVYVSVADTYLEMNKTDQFASYYKLYTPLRDSLHTQEDNIRINSMQEKYENEKKQNEIALLKKEKLIQKASLDKQKDIRNFLIAYVILTLILAAMVFNFFKLKLRSNRKLQQQNTIISKQNRELSEINQTLSALNEKLLISENDLRKSNETKDKFFSIIAHDLRGPLATFTGFLTVVLHKLHTFTPDQLADIAANTEKSLKNLSTLLNNLLQWSQSQIGNVQYNPENVYLSEIADQTIALFSSEVADKNITLTSEISSDTVVYADKNMLGFVIRNLISNSIKFTRPFGHILLSTLEKDESFAEITVRDNGIGIAADSLDKLFHLNSSFTTRGTANEKGTGLGLLLCREFVQKLGGEIHVESELNVGTAFKFTLPLCKNLQEVPV